MLKSPCFEVPLVGMRATREGESELDTARTTVGSKWCASTAVPAAGPAHVHLTHPPESALPCLVERLRLACAFSQLCMTRSLPALACGQRASRSTSACAARSSACASSAYVWRRLRRAPFGFTRAGRDGLCCGSFALRVLCFECHDLGVLRRVVS